MARHDDPRLRRRHASALWLCAAIAPGACAHPPPGRYVVDNVDIERILIKGFDTQGTGRVKDSDIEDKIATAASPRFLGFFPRGVVLDYELYDRYVLERDLARIERYYRARGFYEAHVRAGRVEKTSEGHVAVTIAVQEGPPVNVGEVRIDGLAEIPIDDAAAVFTAVRRRIRKDRAFDEDRFQTAQENLVRALADRGYAFASAKGSAEIDLGRHLADVTLTVTPGQTARLGPITLAGLRDLPEPPVRRALDLTEGELYSASKLESARRAILALGVFSDAEVIPVLSDPASRTVPVNVRVIPSELRAVKLGGGIELDVIRTDVHVFTGWENRNFFGGLRRLTLDLRPGVVLFPTKFPTFKKTERLLLEDRARVELRQPGFIEARTGGILRGEFDIYPVLLPVEENPFILGYLDPSSGVGVDRTFGPLYASFFYNFQTSFPFAYVGDLPPGFKKVVLSYVDLKTNLDFRDDAVRPHAGLFIGNDLQVAGVPVTSNFRGPNSLFAKDLRVQPEVRGYVPLARRWTLAMRVATGFLFPTNYGDSFQQGTAPRSDDVQLVFFRGFFSGGPSSNRGYPYRGVGPKEQVSFFVPGVSTTILPDCAADPNSDACRAAVTTYCLKPENVRTAACNFPTGGLTLWETSVELRFPIAGDLSGAVFCDASDVSRFKMNIRLLYPHFSCGAGLHYNTPVGPLRLDAGFQIPGLQVLDPKADAAEKSSDQFYAISIGIGEAY